MASSYSIFIDNPCSFDECISHLENILDISFIKKNDRPWSSAYFGAMGLSIRITGDLDYEDDMGISFSKYSYQLSVDAYTRVNEMRYWSRLEYYMTMYIYSRICETVNWKCIVLEDLQNLIAGN
ncbi:MAG: hypothetical protein RLZZ381_918 [Cyanobacteriota bacterium]|jgi:hypothetical protein